MLDQNMRQYDEFARDYDWLYSDHVLSGESIIQENKDVLSLARAGHADSGLFLWNWHAVIGSRKAGF